MTAPQRSVINRSSRVWSDVRVGVVRGVHRFEGTVNQFTGDGMMVLFGAPISHEDHAQRACLAALHMRDAVRAFAEEVFAGHGVRFDIRIGLNSGEVMIGRISDDLSMNYTAIGHDVGLAQRMESVAEVGGICLSEHTARLVEGYFTLRDRGRVQVKGVIDPVGVFDRWAQERSVHASTVPAPAACRVSSAGRRTWRSWKPLWSGRAAAVRSSA